MGLKEATRVGTLAVFVQRLMEVEIKWFLCEKLQFLPLEVGRLLVPKIQDGTRFYFVTRRTLQETSPLKRTHSSITIGPGLISSISMKAKHFVLVNLFLGL